MKYIMLPIHSNWVCSIMNGIKKIEVRSGTRLYNAINRLIKEQGKAPCLIYVTRAKPYLRRYPFCLNENFYQLTDDSFNALNGKVVAEFEASANEIIESEGDYGLILPCGESISCWKKDTCLSLEELRGYLKDKDGTAIHIHNLKIFDKPKKLSDFKANEKTHYPLYKAPQSWCYCEVDE